MPFTDQDGYAYRFSWGEEGLRALAPGASVVVIVDVLRFTTAVTVAVERGAEVLPFPWQREDLTAYAAEHGAVAATGREDGVSEAQPWSLSPHRLQAIPAGTRLVLPSPNGSALSFGAAEAGATVVLAACLRNATAVAGAARDQAGGHGSVAVIAAGERWPNGSLRPAVEDLLGAAAVLTALDPSASVSAPACSPEALAARAAFNAMRPRLHEHVCACSSGRELVERDRRADVDLATMCDVSHTVPVLWGDAFVAS